MKVIRKIFVILIILIILFSSLPVINLSLAKSGELVEITFAEKNMYNKICEELGTVIEEKNDSKRIIKVNSNNLNNIKKLNLRNSEISKISGIENFTGLEDLDISNNNISDISYLSSLTNLTKLNVYGCAITTISPLGNLTKLKELNASRNSLPDGTDSFPNLEVIANLTNLEKLDLSHNLLKSTKGIEKFTKLKELNLYNNRIDNFIGLDKLKNLEYLNLGENNEKNKNTITDADLELISQLTNLKYFNFSENKTKNIINYLNNLTNLEWLSLEANDLTDISNLSNLRKLKHLILYNNSIVDISVTANLTSLEELVIGKNKIKDISCLVQNNQIVLNNLKKLDIFNNKIDQTVSRIAIEKLCDMSSKKQIELNYENLVDTSNLPHYDGNIAYVTYDDFGARCDGVYDDYIAMRNAHNFANKFGYEVRANGNKTYHIFKYYEDSVSVNTNVDWKNAKFIIHDEKIEEYSGKFKTLFNIKTITKDIKEIKEVNWTVGKSTKKIPQLAEEIRELNEKGYVEYLVYFENANKKQYIRFGADANSGDNMQDYCTIDKDTNVLNDIQWDFDELTKIKIIPISADKHYVRNGNFVTNPFESQSEVPLCRNSGKGMYFYRNLSFSYCDNMTISNIIHTVPTKEMSGSYAGFLQFDFCPNATIENCTLHTWKYNLRSTYDLNMKRMINLHIKNVDSNDLDDTHRWGIIGSNYCKYVTYENCKFNRIDAHCGIYNLTIKDCEIGCKGLTMTGQGDLNLINTKISASVFISLRSDYGATWDGNMNIINCTYEYDGANSPILFRYSISRETDGSIHEYGYPCKFPNVYIENLTMDFAKNTNSSSMFLILRTDVKSTETEWEEWYKPDKFVINGLNMINNNRNAKILTTKYRFDNFDLTYQVREGMTVEELKQIRPENITVKYSNGEIVEDSAKLETGMRLALNDKCEIVIETITIKGDLDKDGSITVNDLAILKLYLIGLMNLTNTETADLNNDKDVTIDDLARLKLILIAD